MQQRTTSNRFNLNKFHHAEYATFSAQTQNITDSDLIDEILPFLEKQSGIKKINLKNNKIGSTGAKKLIKFLTNHPSITSVDLAFNQIGTDGALLFAKLLTHNQILNTLNLINNGIDEKGTNALVTAFENSKTLQTLDIEWKHMSKAIEQSVESTAIVKNVEVPIMVDIDSDIVEAEAARIGVKFEVKIYDGDRSFYYNEREVTGKNGKKFRIDLMLRCYCDDHDMKSKNIIETVIHECYDANNQYIQTEGILCPASCNNKFVTQDLFNETSCGGNLDGKPAVVKSITNKEMLEYAILCGNMPLPDSEDNNLFQILSLLNDAFDYLKSENAQINFNIIDIMNEMCNAYQKHGLTEPLAKLNHAIHFLKTNNTLSLRDGILLLYCASSFLDIQPVTKKIDSVSELFKVIENVFIQASLEKKSTTTLSMNEFVRRFILCQKIKLMTPILGKIAPSDDCYDWNCAEWVMIRDCQFTYDSNIKRMVIDLNAAARNPKSGYAQCYAPQSPYQEFFRDDMIALFYYLDLSYEKDTNFYDKIIFSKESSKKLFDMGVHLDINSVKDIIKARNNFQFFAQTTRSGLLSNTLPREIIAHIFNLADKPLLTKEQFDITRSIAQP